LPFNLERCTDLHDIVDWNNVPQGNYTLTARIAGSGKQVGISEPVNILVLGTTEFPTVDPNSVRRGIDGVIRFRLNGSANQSFIIQASTDLISWTALSTNTFVGTNFDVSDDKAAQYDRRFYRAAPVP